MAAAPDHSTDAGGSALEAVERHVRAFFRGHDVAPRRLGLGPLADHATFRVLEVSSGPRTQLWTYVSVGASEIGANRAPLEFALCGRDQRDRCVELVTMVAWYHLRQGLGLGHTLPIGEPWLPGASADHLLVSVPYPFGPELELVRVGTQHRHLLWLVPITAGERAFKIANGLDALEQRFEDGGLEYWNPFRACLAPTAAG